MKIIPDHIKYNDYFIIKQTITDNDTGIIDVARFKNKPLRVKRITGNRRNILDADEYYN